MSRRKQIENELSVRWLAYDAAVNVNKEATIECGRDVCLYLACLLNTYLDADNSVDWNGTWADRLLDENIVSELAGVRTARGLMVCSNMDVGYMHLTPFYARFVFSADYLILGSYELFFAPEGPWNRSGNSLVMPFSEDKSAREELLNKLSTEGNWGTVFRKK